MNKDVIYIDVEDDITAIIGKVKASKQKIVALVPPKRIGVLQSTVNLRLIERSAKQSNKQLVIITNNQALIALSAAAKLPVARNLQSKPEVAEISALDVDNGEDIIDGAQLPVGELMKTADKPFDASTGSTLDDIDLTDALDSKMAAPPAPGQAVSKAKSKSGTSVPNFGKFRKKMIVAILAGILLVTFLVWAFFFSARATVIITANTTSIPLTQTVTLSTTAPTSNVLNTVHSLVQEQKKPASVEFDATGEANKGEKATGTVKFTNNTQSSITVAAGTRLTTSGGLVYVTDSAVVVPAGTISCSPFPNCSGVPGSATAAVSAEKGGANYNAASGSLTGAPSGITASFTGPTSGGTDKIVKIVTAADVQKAAESLAQQEDTTIRAKLTAAFGKGVKVIDTSYSVSKSDPVSAPAVGQEATARAKLTTELTYAMIGVPESELDDFLDKALAKKIEDKKDQRAYGNGVEKAAFTDFITKDAISSVKITANGQTGPKINDDTVKAQVKGQRYGEVQSQLESIEGVDGVDVKFWPFWVSSVPDDTKRITIEFKLNESK